MKHIVQFAIILLFSFLGDVLARVLPLGIPASIYGMLLLFFCLLFKIVRLEWIKDTGKFLLEIMPVLFVPVCAGVIDSWLDIKLFFLPVLFAILLITPFVMVVTGKVAQWLIRKTKGMTENE